MRASEHKPCPFCGKYGKVTKYYEDGHLVETDFKCLCGYHYNSSYGQVEIEYPNGYDENGDPIVEEART